MTVGLLPTPPDRPDWLPSPTGTKTIQWGIPTLVATTAATSMLGIQDVSDWQSLLITGGAAGGATATTVYTVSWYADPQGLETIATDVLCQAAGVGLDVALPIRGPYVAIVAKTISGTGTATVVQTVRVSATPAFAAIPRLVIANDNGNSVIAAGATRTIGPLATVTGKCSLNVTVQNCPNFHTEAWVTPAVGAAVQVATLDSGTAHAVTRHDFSLPPLPLTITLQNNDTVSRAIWMSCTVGPT